MLYIVETRLPFKLNHYFKRQNHQLDLEYKGNGNMFYYMLFRVSLYYNKCTYSSMS
jgi:hypothetical protein